LLFILIFSTTAFASEISALTRHAEVFVQFDSTPVEFEVSPVISEGRIIAPLRDISKVLGAEIFWDSDRKITTVSLDNKEVSFEIGSKTMSINGNRKEIDVSAEIIGGRTFVPLRAIADAFNYNVEWNEETRTAVCLALKPLGQDFIISPTYYVASGAFEGCVIACKAMVLSNYFDKPFTFDEILDLNGGSIYANWAPEYSMELSWDVIFQSELQLKQENENWAESAYTPSEKLRIIADSLDGSSGIIAQFQNESKMHGVVITGYTADGELIVCDPDTKSENPQNTLIADSCLANMFKLYTTEELLPYLISMRTIRKNIIDK